MKNKIPKILIRIIVILFIIYIVLNISVKVVGKKLIISQIEKNLNTPADLKGLSISFPLSLNIRGLDIQGLFRADSLSASPSILGFLTGRIVLNELKIVRPVITIEKSPDGKLNFALPEPKGKQPPLLLAGLKIRNGRVRFTDRKADGSADTLALNSINVSISKIAFPITSFFTRFNISALLGDTEGNSKGKFLASGWIDFRPKNMDGSIELKDVDATYLAPYYKKIISTEKLLSAKLNFTSDLQAKNNNLLAKCHLEFSDIIYAKPAETETETKTPSFDFFSNALDLFSGPAGKINLDFTIGTKLDNPKLDLISLKGTIAQAAAQNIANQPVGNVIDKIKNNVEQFKELGKSLEKMFKKKE